MKTWNWIVILIIAILLTSFISFTFGMGTAFGVCAAEARKFIDIDKKLIMDYLTTYRARSGWYGLSNGTAE